MDRQHFDDDDSNPSVNGWIKKEIEDEDFDEYMKNEEEQSGDRYEELMSLPKEELVGRILQQEEDIRFLQDIRQGLDKNVRGFSSSCEHFKKLLEVMSSAVNSLKGTQANATSATTTQSNSRPAVTGSSATPMVTRSSINTPSSQAGPRVTPVSSMNVPTSNASPRSTPNVQQQVPNARSMGSGPNMPSSHMTTSNVVSNDRLPSGTSMSSHQTVTITRQTNVIIKTEIPSPPPPEAMVTSTPPMSSATMSTSTMSITNQKARNEQPPSFYQTRQQQAANKSKQFMPTSSRSITDIANSIPAPRQRAKPNPAMFQFNANASARPSSNQGNKGNMPQFMMQRQTMSSQGNFPPTRGRGRGQHFNQRPVPYTTQKPNPTNNQGVGRARAQPTQTVQSVNPPAPVVNNLLASLKVPSGITLSLVQNKPQNNQDKAMSIVRTLPAEGNRANTSSGSDDGVLASKGDKAMAAGGQINFDDDDEEEDYFDEIAVLIPDKKAALGGENQGQKMSDNPGNNALVPQEVLSDSHSDSGSSYWNNEVSLQKHAAYQNNAEYMFEEADDIDSDENDAKVYLGENVTLPRELVDSCIKQGPNPTKLTRNLMKALFPDMRELASAWADNEINQLPSNKVKAIIALVQKTFPQVKPSAVVLAINMKCKEAKALMSRAGQQQQQQQQQYSNF